MTPVVVHDAVVLAGGRGARLGGIDKPALRLGGRSLLERAVEAVPAARRIAIVSHMSAAIDDPRIMLVGEEPRWAGPVVALAAGLTGLAADAASVTVVLAADLVDPATGVVGLLGRVGVAAGRDDPLDGVVAVDPGCRPQPLLAAYRTRPLLEAVAAVSAADTARGSRGPSMRAVLDRLRLDELVLPWSACADIDTPADAARHGIPLTGSEARRDRVA